MPRVCPLNMLHDCLPMPQSHISRSIYERSYMLPNRGPQRCPTCRHSPLKTYCRRHQKCAHNMQPSMKVWGTDKLEVLLGWRVHKLSDLVNPIAVFMHSYSGIPHIGGGKNRITSREDRVYSLPRSLQKMVTLEICWRKDQMLGVSMHQVPSVFTFMPTTSWATASICGKFCGFFPFSYIFCRAHRQQFIVLLYWCIVVLCNNRTSATIWEVAAPANFSDHCLTLNWTVIIITYDKYSSSSMSLYQRKKSTTPSQVYCQLMPSADLLFLRFRTPLVK